MPTPQREPLRAITAAEQTALQCIVSTHGQGARPGPESNPCTRVKPTTRPLPLVLCVDARSAEKGRTNVRLHGPGISQGLAVLLVQP